MGAVHMHISSGCAVTTEWDEKWDIHVNIDVTPMKRIYEKIIYVILVICNI